MMNNKPQKNNSTQLPDGLLKKPVIGNIEYTVEIVPDMKDQKGGMIFSMVDHARNTIMINASLTQDVKALVWWKEIIGLMLAQAGQYGEKNDSVVTALSFSFLRFAEEN